MYIVANISKKILSISDLNITIPPNQSRDLHKMPLPIEPEKSNDLNGAIKKGYLKIVKRDSKKKAVIEEKHSNKEIDKEALAKIFREELKKMNNQNVTSASPAPDQSETIKQMMAMMQQMQQTMQNQSQSIPQDTNDTNDNFNFDNDDVDQITKIHSKAVKKMTQDVENSIEYQQEKTKDSGLASRADELSDLL